MFSLENDLNWPKIQIEIENVQQKQQRQQEKKKEIESIQDVAHLI